LSLVSGINIMEPCPQPFSAPLQFTPGFGKSRAECFRQNSLRITGEPLVGPQKNNSGGPQDNFLFRRNRPLR
jgi:hypothetical protein